MVTTSEPGGPAADRRSDEVNETLTPAHRTEPAGMPVEVSARDTQRGLTAATKWG
jgi:hypothetical protein